MVSVAAARQSRTDQRRRGEAGNAALIGSGTVLGTTGLVGGGVPGVRSDYSTIRGLKAKSVKERVGSALSSGRGGIFGFRQDAHQATLEQLRNERHRQSGRQLDPHQSYQRGRTAGKIGPEVDILRELRRGRRVSHGLLLGGGGLAAAGLHRRNKGVRKDDRSRLQNYHGALLGTGGTVAGVGAIGGRALSAQERKWAKKETKSLTAAGLAHERGRPELAGRYRGAAAQHHYFARSYRNNARFMRGLRGPGLATAAVGGGGLLLSRRDVGKSDASGDGMPYKSDAQRRFMHARHPGIARRWDAETRESRKQPSYGSSGARGRKVDVDKRTAPAVFNRAAGLGEMSPLRTNQLHRGRWAKDRIAPLQGVVAPGRREAFRGQVPGSAHVAAGTNPPNQNLVIGPRSAPKGPPSRPGVVRQVTPPRTTADQVRGFGAGRAAALQAQRAAGAPRRQAQAYGAGRAAAGRAAAESAPAAGPSFVQRNRRHLVVGATGVVAGGAGANRYELTAKSIRSFDPEAARQRRMGAGVATTGIIGTALAAAGGRRAVNLTRSLRSAPMKLPVRLKLTDDQAHALSQLREGRAVVADRKALALIGGGAATGLGSAALARHAHGERNWRWA